MKVKFLKNIDVSGKVNINEGNVFEAEEDGNFLMIRLPDGRTIKATKSETNGILEMVE